MANEETDLIARLFAEEIPEIAAGVIEIKAITRKPGSRSKLALQSHDPRVDCVGACVGVRGNRIKNIVDELAGERIDIVRWDDNLEVLIPNAFDDGCCIAPMPYQPTPPPPVTQPSSVIPASYSPGTTQEPELLNARK